MLCKGSKVPCGLGLQMSWSELIMVVILKHYQAKCLSVCADDAKEETFKIPLTRILLLKS